MTSISLAETLSHTAESLAARDVLPLLQVSKQLESVASRQRAEAKIAVEVNVDGSRAHIRIAGKSSAEIRVVRTTVTNSTPRIP